MVMSNLRAAPLFLRASVVRQLVGDVHAISKAIVEVPVVPIKLVDRPRRSEDPRLAKANDNISLPAQPAITRLRETDSGRVALPESAPVLAALAQQREPEDWPDAPLPEQPKPSNTRAERAERNRAIGAAYAAGDAVRAISAKFGLSKARVLAIALEQGVPARSLGSGMRNSQIDRTAVVGRYEAGYSLRAVAQEFGVSKALVKDIVVGTGAYLRERGQRSPAYCAKSAEKRAPEPVIVAIHANETVPVPLIEAAAEKLREVAASPAPAKPVAEGFDLVRSRTIVAAKNAAEQHTRQANHAERRARKAAEDDEAVAAFEDALARVRARKAESAEQVLVKQLVSTKIDPVRLAAAHARKELGKSTSVPAPTEPAPSREECPRCGIPGWKGCAHFLPCDGPVAQPEDDQRGSPRLETRFTGRRQGIGVLRI